MKRTPIFVPRLLECPYEHPYGYVYLYTNKINGHKYIGKHKHLKPEIDLSYQGSGTEHHWGKALKKYGWDNFDKEVLFWLERDNSMLEMTHNEILNYWEIYFIDLFGTYVNKFDYNQTVGGDGISLPGELNPMYGKRGKDAPWWGRKHSEEYKQAMRERFTDRRLSQETKDKIAQANSGHTMSEHTKQRVSEAAGKRIGELNPMWKGGKVIVNQKHSDFMKGMRMSPSTEFTPENSSGGKNSQARPIVRLSMSGELLETYDFLGGIRKDPRFPSDESVRKCCKGRQQSYKGFKWMYLEDYQSERS